MINETLLILILEQLDENKGENVKVIDVKDKTSVTDYMVVATGTSLRHIQSLAEHAAEEVKKQGLAPLGIEGEKGCEWVLVDFGDVILHVMSGQSRAFYQLEKLWENDFPVANISN